MSDNDLKYCYKCGCDEPAATFHYNICRKCRCKREREHYAKHGRKDRREPPTEPVMDLTTIRW